MARGTQVGVIGAGIVGLATAYALRERGIGVTVYERGEPGAGQSGGESRIFRHAHDDPRLVETARESRAIWATWEDQLGTELVSRDGVVAVGPAVEERLPLLEEVGGIRARAIDPAELHARLPILADHPGPAMLDEDGGSIRTRAAVAAIVDHLGDGLVRDEVLSIRATSGGSVEVRAGGSTVEHDHLVVCAGASSSALARQVGLVLPVELQVHVRLTFPVRGTPPRHLACLQDSSDVFGESGVYAAPTPGNATYALGLSEAARVREDGSIVDPAELAQLADRARGYVEHGVPGLDPEPVDVRHCWVTTLPWSDDGVAVWRAEGVSVVAGHNLFKHAPWLGRNLTDVAVGGEVPALLGPDAQLGVG